MTKANINNAKVLNTIVEQIIHKNNQIISTDISYCQFHAFSTIRFYMLNETIFI